MLANILSGLLSYLGNILSVLINTLPSSPFQSVSADGLSDWFSWLNYFVPVSQMIVFLSAYLSAVAVWYGIRWVLRFARYIQ